jgi:hypothetical protein
MGLVLARGSTIRRVAVAFVTLALALTGAEEGSLRPAIAATSAPADFFGLYSEDSLGPSPSWRDVILRTQLDAGAGLVRLPFDWSVIEPTQNQWHIDKVDGFMIAAARANMHVLPTLVHTPHWASSAPAVRKKRGYYPPTRLSDMQHFAQEMVARYGPNGVFWRAHPELAPQPIRSWQVWNEPNIPFFWPPGPNAAAYTRMLVAVSDAIHLADPGAQVVSAGLTTSRMGPPLPTFLEDMYRAGAKGHFDVLGVHPYAENAASTLQFLRDARVIMNSHADDSPMWATEFGWASDGDPSSHTTDEAGQAANVEAALRQMIDERTSLKLRGVVYYNWDDRDPAAPDGSSWTSHAGLLRFDASRKPAYYAYRRVALDLTAPVIAPPSLTATPDESAQTPAGNAPVSAPARPFIRVTSPRTVVLARDGSLRLSVTCVAPGVDSRCAGGARIERPRPKHAPYVLARRHYELANGRSVKLRLALGMRARKMVKGVKRMAVHAVFTGTAADRELRLTLKAR